MDKYTYGMGSRNLLVDCRICAIWPMPTDSLDHAHILEHVLRPKVSICGGDSQVNNLRSNHDSMSSNAAVSKLNHWIWISFFAALLARRWMKA
jgi:hypothetical protein